MLFILLFCLCVCVYFTLPNKQIENHRHTIEQQHQQTTKMAFCFVYFEKKNVVVVTGTIAPSRDIPDLTAEETIRIILSNMNLVVPVVCAIAVIIIAIVVCILRSKGNHHKGIFNNYTSFD